MRKWIGLGMLFAMTCVAQKPDATQPPPSQHPVLTVHGRGVQIYSCKPVTGSSGPQWVFVAPAARLFDEKGTEVGTHGDGPVWQLQDGSSLYGQAAAKSASPDASAVPWLLLKSVRTEGNGTLKSVEYVRRSETKGGAAPAGSCEMGALLRVPYEATYTFFSSR